MKNKFLLLYLFLISAVCLSVKAQPVADIWRHATQKALKKDWQAVREFIKPHIFPAPEDSLAPALIQLYALAACRTGDETTARASILRLQKEYGRWSGIGNAYFLSGEMYFSKQKYAGAWMEFEKAGSSFENRLTFYISERYKKIPKDTPAALTSSPAFSQTMAARIVQKLIQEEPAGPSSFPRIGLVLPLDLKKIQTTGRENPSAEFCRGFLLASEMLAAQDSALDIHIFDYENDEKKLEKMIREKAFRGLNAVVGPIKSNAAKILEKEMKANKTLMINPLATPVRVSDSAFSFFQQPSPQRIASEAFEFMSGFSSGRRVGIIYGTEKNDSLKAEAYRDVVKKMGREVTLFKKVGKNSAANLTKFLVESGLDSTDHLFVPNSEDMVKAQLPGAYGWTKARYPILVAGNWLESAQADFDEYSRLLIFFLNPDFLNPASETRWNEWKSNYVAKYAGPPSWMAWKGFDLACVISHWWYGNGAKDGPEGFKSKSGWEGPLFGQYIFSGSAADNQYVPVFQINREGIQRVWPGDK